jgi:hypothetical protein
MQESRERFSCAIKDIQPLAVSGNPEMFPAVLKNILHQIFTKAL